MLPSRSRTPNSIPEHEEDSSDAASISSLPTARNRATSRAYHKRLKPSVHLPLSSLMDSHHKNHLSSTFTERPYQSESNIHKLATENSNANDDASDVSTDEEIEAVYQQAYGMSMDIDEDLIISQLQQQTAFYFDPDWKAVGKRIIFKVVWTLGLILIFGLPGLICFYTKNCMLIWNVPIVTYSLTAVIASCLYFVVGILNYFMFVMIHRIHFLASRFSYYASYLEVPCGFLLFVISLILTWTFYLQYQFPVIQFNMNYLITTLLTFSVWFVVKAILVRFLAIKFHRGAYLGRLIDAIFMEFVIARLSRNEVDQVVNSSEKPPSLYSISVNTGKHQESTVTLQSQKLSEKQLLSGLYSTYQLSSFISYFKRSTFFSCLNYEMEDFSRNYGRKEALKRLALHIFSRVSKTVPMSVSLTDFSNIFKNPILARRALAQFDQNQDGFVTRIEFQAAFISFYHERVALCKALHEGENAISKLDLIVSCIGFLLAIIIDMLLCGLDVTALLVTVSSITVSISFACGKSVQRIVDSVQFIFFLHPYDLGDRVNCNGINYFVTKMNILTTEMLRYDNAKVLLSNSVLIDQPILNYRRSPEQWDSIAFDIDYQTPISRMKILEQRVSRFLKEFSMHFHRTYLMEISETIESDKMTIKFWVQHRSCFQNVKRFCERHALAILKIIEILQELDIRYVPNPKKMLYMENKEL